MHTHTSKPINKQTSLDNVDSPLLFTNYAKDLLEVCVVHIHTHTKKNKQTNKEFEV